MKRKKVISPVKKEQSSPEVLAARTEHEAKGYRITNMKEILLHNVVAFQALEEGTYSVVAELKKHLSPRTITFFGYAISKGNQCLICGHYFKKLVTDMGVKDFEHFSFTDEEQELIDFAGALATDANHVPDAMYEKLQERYDEETLVLIVTYGVMTLANNYFNNIVGTQLDSYLYDYYDGDIGGPDPHEA